MTTDPPRDEYGRTPAEARDAAERAARRYRAFQARTAARAAAADFRRRERDSRKEQEG
jgi:hypothetical protein